MICRWFRKRLYTVEMFLDHALIWRWRIRHTNGEILASSEAYSSKQACHDTASALAKDAGWKLVVLVG